MLDVKTDPNVPPLPPNITYEQAKQYAEALLQGAPEAVGIVWQSLKASIQSVLPSRGRAVRAGCAPRPGVVSTRASRGDCRSGACGQPGGTGGGTRRLARATRKT
ncbi:MAG: hypothetical protein ACREJ5_24375 [Geminicoccaceae bacterium]